MDKMALKVGIFIVTIGVMMITSLFYVAWEKELFASMNRYKLTCSSGEGVTEGMPIVFRGFEIGVVESFELAADGRVHLIAKIAQRHAKWIHTDSRFILDKPLVGEPKLLIETPSLTSALLPLTEERPIITRDGITEMIQKAQPILAKVDNIVGNVNILTTAMASQQKEFVSIIQDVAVLTHTYSKSKSLIEMATGDPESARFIARMIKKSEKFLDQVEGILTKVDTMAGVAQHEMKDSNGTLALAKGLLFELIVELKKVGLILDEGAKVTKEVAGSANNLGALRQQLELSIKRATSMMEQIDRRLGSDGAKEWEAP